MFSRAGDMKVRSRTKAGSKKRCMSAKTGHAALDRIHAAAKHSRADELTDDEIDALIAKARSKKAKTRGRP